MLRKGPNIVRFLGFINGSDDGTGIVFIGCKTVMLLTNPHSVLQERLRIALFVALCLLGSGAAIRLDHLNKHIERSAAASASAPAEQSVRQFSSICSRIRF